MKSIRSLASAIALASLFSTACLTAHAADIPLGSSAMEGHIVSRVLAVDPANYQVTIEGRDKNPVPIPEVKRFTRSKSRPGSLA
jgi:hypothetical protein